MTRLKVIARTNNTNELARRSILLKKYLLLVSIDALRD